MTTKRKNYVEQPLDLPGLESAFAGLDMSLNSSGVALIEPGIARTWNWSPPKMSSKGPARLEWFEDTVREFLQDEAHGIPVCLEDYAYGRGNQAHQVGELGGIVRLTLHKLYHRAWLVDPGNLKKLVTGNGNASKAHVPLDLLKRWGLDVRQEDQADATGAALCGFYAETGTTRGLTKPRIEAIQGKKGPKLICAGLSPVRRRRLSPGTKNVD